MSNNHEGGIKSRDKMLARDPDYYKKIGALGGRKPTVKPKGFAANPELARKAGAIGGKISRRGKAKETK